MRFFNKALAIVIMATACFAQEVPESPAGGAGFVMAALTVQVKGEDGQLISDADVHLGFTSPGYKDGFNDFRGKSDAQGLFHGKSKLSMEILIEVSKEGYYPSKLDYNFSGENNPGIQPGDDVRPWNPTQPVMLKKIGNPIPMIVRDDSRQGPTHKAPDLEIEYAFDMMRYDWVAPHGKGETPDFWVRFSPELDDPENPGAKARLRFSNPDDGMIRVGEFIGKESKLKFPRIAPEEGYQLKALEVVGYRYGKPANADSDPPVGYLFRIRTVKDPKTGQILSASYGKITEPTMGDENAYPIQVEAGYGDKNPPSGKLNAYLRYNSYINPTANDRNLEFDTRNNLAPDMEDGYRAP